MSVPDGTALAKLEGRIFFSSSDFKFVYYIEQPCVKLGRSDPLVVSSKPLQPAQKGVDVGLGDSNKLSRSHAKIEYDRSSKAFLLHCIGKNGLTITTPDTLETFVMSPETRPVQLNSRALIQMGDCVFVFLLPAEYPSSTKKRREWIKAEHVALRTLMMRLGYGRWEEIIASTNGRLSERTVPELIPVARKFVARCYIHARPGVEQKVLGEILREDMPPDTSEEEAKAETNSLIQEAKQLAEPNEKRKYVRWARKLRLLRRLRDIHEHSSLERLRAGELRVFTPPPAPYWTCADDVDLILGTYRHGYGATETIRLDPQLGFHNRFSKPLPVPKKGSSSDRKSKSSQRPGTNPDDDDDPDAEDEEEEEEEDVDGDPDDARGDHGSVKAAATNKETRLLQNGTGISRSVSGKPSVKRESDGGERVVTPKTDPDSHGELGATGEQKELVSVKDEAGVATQDTFEKKTGVEDRENGEAQADPLQSPEENGKKFISDGDFDQNAADPMQIDHPENSCESSGEKRSGAAKEEPVTSPVKSAPRGEKRDGKEARAVTAEGTNSDAAAKAAAEAAAGEDGLVPFPSSEALMRRLKSIINSCAKEFERDQREMRKLSQAQSRAQRRKDDLAQRKAEKAAERNRQREERRIAKSQPFSKKDALEFERALGNFGLDYLEDGTSVDWAWFISKAPAFQSKYHETLDRAYNDFIAEAHRVVDTAAAEEDEDYERLAQLQEQSPSTLFTQLTVDRAERVLDRLRFFRLLRNDVLTHRALNAILRGFKRTRELPMWWRSTHDRSLLWGVDRHGFNAWDAMASDSELAFAGSIKSFQRKHADDAKMLKRGAFPKASAAIKRANSLVVNFRSKAADPMFEQYARENGGMEGADRSREVGRSRGAGARIKGEVGGGKKTTSLNTDGGVDLGSGSRNGGDDGGVDMREDKTGNGGSGSHPLNAREEGAHDEEDPPFPRVKADTRATRTTILHILDENGTVKLPANLGDGLYLLNLGDIRYEPDAFHTDRLLFPVGFQSVRQMGEQAFLCEIRENSDGRRPVFRVSLLEGFEVEAHGQCSWSSAQLISEGNTIGAMGLEAANVNSRAVEGGVELASGAERFGLYEPTVVHYLQQLPGARKCGRYLFRDFSTEGAGAVVVPPVGILAAMSAALFIAKKRSVDEMMDTDDNVLAERDMDIPPTWARSFGGGKRKRRKSSSYWG